jgi:hypothetical protein
MKHGAHEGQTARTYWETFTRHYWTGTKGRRLVREWVDAAGNIASWEVVAVEVVS